MWSWCLLREKGTTVGCTIAVGSATAAILKELSPRVYKERNTCKVPDRLANL